MRDDSSFYGRYSESWLPCEGIGIVDRNSSSHADGTAGKVSAYKMCDQRGFSLVTQSSHVQTNTIELNFIYNVSIRHKSYFIAKFAPAQGLPVFAEFRFDLHLVLIHSSSFLNSIVALL